MHNFSLQHHFCLIWIVAEKVLACGVPLGGGQR
jgi:hypothetical protein